MLDSSASVHGAGRVPGFGETSTRGRCKTDVETDADGPDTHRVTLVCVDPLMVSQHLSATLADNSDHGALGGRDDGDLLHVQGVLHAPARSAAEGRDGAIMRGATLCPARACVE